jgi:chemotaxis protein methyltransferase CheR
MRDVELVEFLQWVLPRLRLRWPGYRKVRRQVGKRIGRRLGQLGLTNLDAYRARLATDRGEWRRLDALCRITISRFYRNRGVWDALRARALPDLAREAGRRGDRHLRIWSAGCASGEEPYTLALAWHLELAPVFPDLELRLLASDADAALLARAQRAVYPESSLKELPAEWRDAAFRAVNHEPTETHDTAAAAGPVADSALADTWRRGVYFARHDVRGPAPVRRCDLIVCRNLPFTYFDRSLQRSVAAELVAALAPGGLLLVAPHETVPAETGLTPDPGVRGLHRAAV